METSDESTGCNSMDTTSTPDNGNNETFDADKVLLSENGNEIQDRPQNMPTTTSKTKVDAEQPFNWRISTSSYQTNGNIHPETEADFLNKPETQNLWGLSQSELITKLLQSQSKVEYLQNICQRLGHEFCPDIYELNDPDTTTKDQNQNTCRNESEVKFPIPSSTFPLSPDPLTTNNSVLLASDSFALVPSPCVTTPPYEYIVLTKNNEKKFRIFVNQKIDSVFKEELAKVKKKSHEDGGNDDFLSPTPSILPKPHKSSDATIINCFDPSDVDVQLKTILKANPPLTHKIVRRKPRLQRGSSVPAIDSYYGTQDLERVGHASYFIPELTSSERKIIGWKEQYSYGLWKYSKQKLTENLSSGKSFLSRNSFRELVRKSKSDGHKNKTCVTTSAAATHQIYQDGSKDIHPKVAVSIPRTSRFRTILRGHSSINDLDSDSLQNYQRTASANPLLLGSSSGSISGTCSSSSSTSSVQKSCFGKKTNRCKQNRRTLKKLARCLIPCYKRQQQGNPIPVDPIADDTSKKNGNMNVGDTSTSETVPDNGNANEKVKGDIGLTPESKVKHNDTNPTDRDQHKSHGHHHHRHHHGHHHHGHHHHGHHNHHHGHHHHHHRVKVQDGCFHHKPAHRIEDQVLGGDLLISADDSIISVLPVPATPTRQKHFELGPVPTSSASNTILKPGITSSDSENLNNNLPLPPSSPNIPATDEIPLVKQAVNLEVISESGNSGSATISTIPSPSMQVSTNSFHDDPVEGNNNDECYDEDEDYDYEDIDEESQFTFNDNNTINSSNNHFGPSFSPHKKCSNNNDEDDVFETVPETRFLDPKDLDLRRYQYKKPSITFQSGNGADGEDFENEYYEEEDEEGDEEEYEIGEYFPPMNTYAVGTPNNNDEEYDPSYLSPNSTSITATILNGNGIVGGLGQGSSNNNNSVGSSNKKSPLILQDCQVV